MGLLPTPTGQPPSQPGGMPEPPPNDAPPEAGAQETDEGEPNVTPEEQAAYDKMIKAASDIIYGKGEVMPEILQSLQPAKEPASEGGNPAVLALANTATQVIQKLDVASKDAGEQIPDDVLYHGGTEIIEMLAEIAEHAGLHDYTQDEINGALFQTVDNYRPIAEEMGRTTDATLKGQFQEVEDADKAGKLGDLLPGAGGTTESQPPVQPEA